MLGDGHPTTLAVALSELGQVDQAQALAEDTLSRQRRFLGEDHSDTLSSPAKLAV